MPRARTASPPLPPPTEEAVERGPPTPPPPPPPPTTDALLATLTQRLESLEAAVLRGQPAAAHRAGEPSPALVPAETDGGEPTSTEARDMLLAARTGNMRELTRLLRNNANNIRETDENGRSPLHYAADSGHVGAVRLLLENRAQIAATDNDGSSPLRWAAGNGHEGAVRLLLEMGAQIAATDYNGRSPLHWAAGNGHVGAVRLLLEMGAQIQATDNDGHSPLHTAASNGRVEAVRVLLEMGAQIAARSNEGYSPLHAAASTGHEGAVRLLLENHALIGATSDAGHSALYYAAYRGHVGAARLLLENHAQIAARAHDGRSPLHAAAKNGHEGAVRLLLENNADIAARDSAGDSPFHLAERYGHGGAARLLLENTADTAARSNDEHSPLHLTAMHNNEGQLSELLDINMSNNGSIPLQLASERGRREAVETELEGRCEAAEAELARERGRRVAAEAELTSTQQLLVAARAELARTQQLLDTVLQAQQRSIAVISLAELRDATGGFSHANIVGQGGFGPVFRTHQPLPSLPHSGPCAVKQLGASSMQGHLELHSEIRVLSTCWHENLLPLLGFCLDEDTPCLVYPLVVGNLESRVVGPPGGQPPFSWQERVRAIRDATRALVYLHTPLARKNVVLHRDVKPSNILLDTQGNAKLADVGLAREAPELQGSVTHLATLRLIGTPGFIDPLYTQSGQTSTYTDGYAMGVSLLMCLSGRPAMGDNRRELADVNRAATFLDPTVQWPSNVAGQALAIVRGLILGDQPAQRMRLPEALSRLEDMANAGGLHPGIADAVGEDAGRSVCVICMAAPRAVRFNCGHALCCTVNGCAAAILRQGSCPNCRREIDEFADQGDHIALQHTFVAVI